MCLFTSEEHNTNIFFVFYFKSMSRTEKFEEELNNAFQNGELLLTSVTQLNPQKPLMIPQKLPQLSLKMYYMNKLEWTFPNDMFNSQFACVSIQTCAIGLNISVAIVKLFDRSARKIRRATLIFENATGNVNNFSNMFKILPLHKSNYEEMDMVMLLSPSRFPSQDSVMCWTPTDLTSPIQYWRNERSGTGSFIGVVDGFMARSEDYKTASCNQYALLGVMNNENLHIYKYIVTSNSYGFHMVGSEEDVADFDMNERFLAYQKLLSNGERRIHVLTTSYFETEDFHILPSKAAISLNKIDYFKFLDVNLFTNEYIHMYLRNTFIAITTKNLTNNEEDLLLYTNFQHPVHKIKDTAQRNFALFDHHYIVETNEGWEYHVLDFRNSIIAKEIKKRFRSEDLIDSLSFFS